MTVRDIRLHWPKAEQALRRTGELIVTRDGTPVARVVPFEQPVKKRRRFKKSTHLSWLAAFWKKKPRGPSTGAWLARDRDE